MDKHELYETYKNYLMYYSSKNMTIDSDIKRLKVNTEVGMNNIFNELSQIFIDFPLDASENAKK